MAMQPMLSLPCGLAFLGSNGTVRPTVWQSANSSRDDQGSGPFEQLLFHLLLRVPRRRQSNMAGERDAERTCGAVADAFRNFGDASFFTLQQVLCQSHAPG